MEGWRDLQMPFAAALRVMSLCLHRGGEQCLPQLPHTDRLKIHQGTAAARASHRTVPDTEVPQFPCRARSRVTSHTCISSVRASPRSVFGTEASNFVELTSGAVTHGCCSHATI